MAKPTQGQLDKCEQLGIEVPANATKVQVTELIKQKEEELKAVATEQSNDNDGAVNTEDNEPDIKTEDETEDNEDETEDNEDETEDDLDNDKGEDFDDVEINSWGDVKQVLSLQTTVVNKLAMLSKCGFKPVELFVAFYIDYGNSMGTLESGMKVTEQEGARLNTRLFNNLLNIVREKDDEVFKIKMDIVNFVFKDGGDDAFDDIKLCRFSDSQKLSSKQLSTYHRLAVLISSLADASTRGKNKKSLSGFGGNNTVLTDEDVARLKRYYNL